MYWIIHFKLLLCFAVLLIGSPLGHAEVQLEQFLGQAAKQLDKPGIQPEQLEPLEDSLEALLNKIHERKVLARPEVQHFVQSVKPIFEQKCFACHSDQLSMAELNLSTRELLLQGGSRGASVDVENPDESLLLQLVRHEREPKMPQGMDPLSDDEIDALKTWIEQGAVYDTVVKQDPNPDAQEPVGQTLALERVVPSGVEQPQWKDAQLNFWSYQPLKNYDMPKTENKTWGKTPIDAFVLAKMEAQEVVPAEAASKRALIRRLYFDLIGLPPTPDVVEAFVANDDDDAYELLVDELLTSQHFGERWGRHWLDVARYADSGGYEFDVERPNAYTYRDFVIQAYNDDLPFDSFIKWQLAGDEYAPDNPMALAATGFCTSGPTISNQEAEINRYNELDDMVSTTSLAMMGQTVACARCHDHKFDPISQYDYYRMTAFFTSSKREVRYLADADTIERYEAEAKAHREKLREAKNHLAEFKEKFSKPIRVERIDALPISVEEKVLLKLPIYKDLKEQQSLLKEYAEAIAVDDEEWLETLCDEERQEYDHLQEKIAKLEETKPEAPTKGLTLTDQDTEPVLSYFLDRGEPSAKQALIKPGFLSVITAQGLEADSPWFVEKPLSAKTTYRRSALAEWITDVEHGAGALSARVYVNRVWQHLMGEGLVSTPNDFGFQGAKPTHPELLDWLSIKFLENGGSTKQLIRLIVNSAVYQQSATPDPSSLAIDPDNQLLTRRSLKRIEAEIQRDAVLALSGSLNTKMYGPGVKPYMHPDAIATGSTNKWPVGVEDNPETWRRSVYMFIQRSVLHPLMSLFDAPDTTASCAKRIDTIVPTQALTMLNDQFMREQSALFAQRILDECGDESGVDLAECIKRVFHLALSRLPSDEELKLSQAFISDQQKRYENEIENNENIEDINESMKDDVSITHLALTDFCQSVINLNEFVYIQ